MNKTMTNDKQTTTEGAAISVQRLVIMAVFVAMTFVVTTYINVRIPFLAANGGLVHLGNVPVFVAAAVFGKKEGAVTGAFGLGLFDLLNGIQDGTISFVASGESEEESGSFVVQEEKRESEENEYGEMEETE